MKPSPISTWWSPSRMIQLLLLLLSSPSIITTTTALPAECSNGDFQEQSLAIVLNVQGYPDTLSQADYDATQNAFMQAYNELGSNDCFQITAINNEESTSSNVARRRMLRASSPGSEIVSHDEDRRQLANYNFNFALFFFIILRCFGCPNNAHLLNDASRRRLLSAEELFSHRMLSDEGPTCAATTSCSGPSTDDFQQRVTEILNDNPPPSINNVLDVAELKTYDCSPQIDTISTQVTLTLVGDYSHLQIHPTTSSEIEVMEHTVHNAFNSANMANSETCDEEFRRVTSANYVSSTALPDGKFEMTFDVEYNCRDCANADSRTLFDTADSDEPPGRTHYYFDPRDPGPNEPECVCAINAFLFRGPTAHEFAESVRMAIMARAQDGVLTFVTDIDPNNANNAYERQAEVVNAPTNSPGTQGDPIILGLKGQVFKFDGRDGGWYANIASKSFNWNMQFRKYPTCPEGADVFISGLSFITSKESNAQHRVSESNVLIATTQEPIPECRSFDSYCLGDGTLHISFDGGKTYISQPGDYHYAGRNRIIAHNTFAACSRRWHDYEVSPEQKNVLNNGGRRVTIVEKKPLDVLLERNETMIEPDVCFEWIKDRRKKDDLFQQKGLWASLKIETPNVSFNIEYRQSNIIPVEGQCKFQSLDSWMTHVAKNVDKQGWEGILGETKKKLYDGNKKQILSDRKILLRGNDDADYEVDGPFGLDFNANRIKNKIASLPWRE